MILRGGSRPGIGFATGDYEQQEGAHTGAEAAEKFFALGCWNEIIRGFPAPFRGETPPIGFGEVFVRAGPGIGWPVPRRCGGLARGREAQGAANPRLAGGRSKIGTGQFMSECGQEARFHTG